MENEKLRLEAIYKDTERSGSKINLLDLKVIATRFQFASRYVSNKSVVEFGAGSILGKSTILSECSGYTAVEIHPETAMDLRRSLGSKYTVLNENCCATSLPDNCCDLIIAFAMIYYNDFENLISEAARLLTSDGKIIFCSPNSRQPNFKPAPGSTEYLQPDEIVKISAHHGISVRTYCAYPCKEKDNNQISRYKQMLRAPFYSILSILKSMFPRLYLFLRALKFGKVEQISDDISRVTGFELPVDLDMKSNMSFRMYYYEGTKK